MGDVLLVEYVGEVERLSQDLQGRGRALGFNSSDVRSGCFNNASNSLTMYAVSLTLLHAAQQLGRGSFTVVVDGEPEPVQDALIPRVIDTLFKDRHQGGRVLWHWYLAKLRAQLFQ